MTTEFCGGKEGKNISDAEGTRVFVVLRVIVGSMVREVFGEGEDGLNDGLTVGFPVGSNFGFAVIGLLVGSNVGFGVIGLFVGCFVGFGVVGLFVRSNVGFAVISLKHDPFKNVKPG